MSNSTDNIRSSKRLTLFVAVWGVLTAITSIFSIASWTFHIDGPIRVIENLTYLISVPGWVPLYIFGFGGLRDDMIGITVAHSIAWVFWLFLVFFIVQMRSKIIVNGATESAQAVDQNRRAFLSNATIGFASIGAVATPGYATLVEPWSIKVRRYSIPINGLDPSLDGLKLVQLSDIHLGPRIPGTFVQQAIDLVIQQDPDLVLLTGDYVHDGTNEIERAAEMCRPLINAAKIGVVGVLGNHDWWGDGEQMSLSLSQIGVHMIDNDRIWLDASSRTLHSKDPGSSSLALVGFGDLTDHYINITSAFNGVHKSTPRVVLSHNPDSAELRNITEVGAPRVDLMCSGHTHGGQVRIPFIGTPIVPSKFGSKYAGGVVNGPAFPVHISRGIGMSLLPIRIGVPPEISVLTLMSV
ncbi:MAG: metallophosphoesterase [Phycisphaerales bacterium]|nr:metallophosphoesterase [Phycisphaerales bacterium]